MSLTVGVSTFEFTYGGIQIEQYNHIKNSLYDYVIFADGPGQMESLFNELPNVKNIIYCKDDDIPKLAKEYKCGVFFHHTVNHTNRKSITQLKSNGIPVVVFHHCAWEPQYNSSVIDEIITTSGSNIDIIRKNASFKNKVIHKTHLSIDTEYYDKILSNSIPNVIRQKFKIPLISTVIGRVGRLEICKCPEDFIITAGKLKKTIPNLFFICAGMLSTFSTPQYLDDLKRLANKNELEVNKDIIFTGDLSLEDKIQILSVMDIYLYPTRWEGYCVSFLEAMYCGKPIITYDHLANEETIGDAGLLVCDGDLKGLERNTSMLIKDPDMRKLLGAKGKDIVLKRNNIKDYVHKIDKILRDVKISNPMPVNIPTVTLVEVKPPAKKILNICQVGWGLVDKMVSSPEYLQLVHMQKAGHNIDFFCVTPKGMSEINGIRINRSSYFDTTLMKYKPDVVHVHHAENPLSFQAVQWAYQNNIPTVMNIHSIVTNISQYVNLVDRFVVQSEKEYTQRGKEVDKNKIRIIPNGLDIDIYKNKTKQVFDENKINVLFVGQYCEQKGIYTFVNVANKIRLSKDSFEFHMATHVKTEFEKLKAYIGSAYPYIKLYPASHGEREFQDLINMYHSCDIFFLPTKADCFPTTVLEAMICGKPVVATTVGGVADQIDHEITGFHVYPDANEHKLVLDAANCLIKLVNPDLRKKMGEAGYNKVLIHYDIKKNVQRYVELYQELILK